jgi:hypothetical protein
MGEPVLAELLSQWAAASTTRVWRTSRKPARLGAGSHPEATKVPA